MGPVGAVVIVILIVMVNGWPGAEAGTTTVAVGAGGLFFGFMGKSKVTVAFNARGGQMSAGETGKG